MAQIGGVVEGPAQCTECGYDLAGLDRQGVCPECGRQVRESLAWLRRGSPWQRAPGIRSWMETTASLVTSPRAMWDEVRVDEWQSWNLLNLNLLLASSGWLWLGLIFGDWMAGVALLMGTFLALLVLNMVLVGVMRLLRGGTGAGALAAAGHASGWWVIGAAAAVLALALGAGSFAAAAGPVAGAAAALSMWVGAGKLRYVGVEGVDNGSTPVAIRCAFAAFSIAICRACNRWHGATPEQRHRQSQASKSEHACRAKACTHVTPQNPPVAHRG